MTSENNPRSEPKGLRKFDWTKIHLLYFALAAFDLVAIGSGLELSEWSKSAHLETVKKLEQTNFLRNELSLTQEFAVKLSAISNDVFVVKDTRAARRDLKILESFNKAMASEKAFTDRLNATFPARSSNSVKSLIGDNSADQATAKGITDLQERLNMLEPAVVEKFESNETEVKSHIQVMFDQSHLALANFDAGRTDDAASNMGLVDSSFRSTINGALATNAILDNAMRQTVKESEVVLQRSTWLQYIIGGAIVIMIGLACTYAHFVGKILRSKYAELQKAHDESIEHAAFIETVNDDVTKLNVELANNMKRLSEAQDELVKRGRMEQLGHLTATVAHELRNPLGAVRTSAFLLERKIKDKGLGVEPQLLRISNGISRCDNIITQLLDFSRSSKLTCKEADLDQWLVKVIEDLAKRLPQSVAFTCELGLHNLLVPFDEARLERAIINLVSNASEAMVGNGTEASKIVTTNPHIKISTLRVGDTIKVEISDNGPGIPADIMTKIREPLFTTKSFGTGLGIPAVEQIAEQHGGKLEISSEIGVGSKFVLCLPLSVKMQDVA